jgi:seryl-tRNA synthetase
MLIAILENFQRQDGSVAVPEALHPYLPEQARVLTPS